jgi:hypothetical protein
VEPAETRIQKELQEITAIVMELTGLPSCWSGVTRLVPDADFRGKKRFICDIEIDAALAARPERWATLLHEVLHSVSVGNTPSDYWSFPGWEEGVVEQVQRLLRPTVLLRLGILIDETTFTATEAQHAYNLYIGALEKINQATLAHSETFYIELLRTPLKQRATYALSLGNSLTGAERVFFLQTFSAANATLKGNR